MSNRILSSIIYAFMAGSIIFACLCVPQLKFASSISEISALDERIQEELNQSNNLFDKNENQSIVIVENTNGWFNENELRLINNISTEWKNDLPEIEFESATTIELPIKSTFGIRQENPLVKNDFDVQTIEEYDDVYSKFFSKNGKYCLIYLKLKTAPIVLELFLDFQSEYHTQLSYLYFDEYHLLQDIQQDAKQNFWIVTSVVFLLIILVYFVFVRKGKLLFPLIMNLLFIDAVVIILMCWLNITVTPQITTIPALLCVLSLSDMIHISYLLDKTELENENERKKFVLKRLLLSLVLTSFTNVIGFIFFILFSHDVNLIVVSKLAVAGVIVAFISTTCIFILTLNSTKKYYKEKSQAKILSIYKRILAPILAKKKSVLSVFIVLCLVSVSVVTFILPTMLQSSSDQQSNQKEINSSSVLSTEFFGNHQVELIFNSQDSLFYKSMIEIEKYVIDNFNPSYVESELNIMRRYNRFWFHGDENKFTIPEYNNLNEEFNIMKYAFGWSSVVSKDGTNHKLTFGYSSTSLKARIDAYNLFEKFLFNQFSNDDFTYSITSEDYYRDKTEYNIIYWVLIGVFITLLTSMVLISIVKLNLIQGIMFLMVNIFPISIAFILMYFFNVPVNAFTVFMITVLIGVCLDDSIYLLLTKDLPPFNTTLFPIVFTTLIMAVAMLGYSFSVYEWLKPFGLIFFIAFMIALLSDILILPLVLKSEENK